MISPLSLRAIGLYKPAMNHYSAVIRLKPESADAFLMRARLYDIDEDYVRANEDYRMVRILDPSNEEAIHNQALHSFQKQLWSDSISEFSKLIEIDPERASCYMFRGRSYAALSFFSEAMKDLTRAIKLEPDNGPYFFHRGCLLREQHSMRAIQDFSLSIILTDDLKMIIDAYFYRARLYQKIKQYDLAISDYQIVIERNPTNSRAMLNLGSIYMNHLKDYPEALEHINRAISIDPRDLRGYICRGELNEHRYIKALLLQNTAAATKRKIRMNSKIDNSAQFASAAVRDYSRAIHIRPSNYVFLLYRGRLLLKQGKIEEATKDFNAAFDMNSHIAQRL